MELSPGDISFTTIRDLLKPFVSEYLKLLLMVEVS